MNESNIKPNGLALLPILVFLILFLGTGIVLKDFYTMPAVVGFLIALIVAFAQTKGRSFNEKLSIVAKGVGDDNIITMCLIFLAAGAFFRLRHCRRRRRQYGQSGTVTASAQHRSYWTLRYRLLHLHLHGNFGWNHHRTRSYRRGHR